MLNFHIAYDDVTLACTVGEMLNTTDMDVIVYQGQLDLICLTKGANDWVLKLQDYWDGLDDFLVADR